MQTFLTILLIVAMIATVFMLVRGVVAFLRTSQEDLNSGGTGPSVSGMKQNRAMMGRVLFQALAVVIVVLLLLLSRG